MAKTLEDLEKEYENRELDRGYFDQQAVLGSEEDATAAWDDEGNFHCIEWFNCQYCPAFNAKYCI